MFSVEVDGAFTGEGHPPPSQYGQIASMDEGLQVASRFGSTVNTAPPEVLLLELPPQMISPFSYVSDPSDKTTSVLIVMEVSKAPPSNAEGDGLKLAAKIEETNKRKITKYLFIGYPLSFSWKRSAFLALT